jgi:hypothetical protein
VLAKSLNRHVHRVPVDIERGELGPKDPASRVLGSCLA